MERGFTVSAKDDPVVGRFANAVVVVLLFVVTVVAAYQEGYLIWKESVWEVLRAPVWAVLVGGTLVVLWMSFSITTKRLLSLIVAVLLIELVNQWVSTKLGLWTYTAEGGTFIFGLCAWILSGLAAYAIASKAVVRLTGETGYRFPDLLAPLMVIAAFLLIWFLGPWEVEPLPASAPSPDQVAFWLLYGALMLGGAIAAAWAGLRVTFGVFISAWIVGFISEASGAASGIWYYASPSLVAEVAQQLQANKVIQASPPIYLILGCWSLEVLAQFALSALIANERLVETNGQAAPPDHDRDDGTGGEPPTGGAGPKGAVNLGQPGPPAQSQPGNQSLPEQDSGLQDEGEGAKPSPPPMDSHDSEKRCSGGEGAQPPAAGGKDSLERPKKSQIDETLCWEEDPRADLTEAERTLRAVMFISAVAYLVVGFVFAIKPGFVVYILEDFSRLWNPPWDYPPWQNKFWVSMTFSMMMCITFLSFYVQYNIRKK